MLDRIKSWFAHSRTIFAARMVTLAGGLTAFHDAAMPYVTGADFTPISAKLPAWALPLILVGAGMLFDWLRHITTESLADKATA